MGNSLWPDAKMYTCKILLVLVVLVLASVTAECPHQQFLQESVCDECRGWKEVLKQQKAAGATGITTVLGPPTHSFPPLFRQTGLQVSDLCINRQPRPAYRCNMAADKKYCFKIGNLCYAGHSPISGEMYKVLRVGLVECVEDHTQHRQNTADDFNETNRRGDPRYD